MTGVRPVTSMPAVTAGLTWAPDTWPNTWRRQRDKLGNCSNAFRRVRWLHPFCGARHACRGQGLVSAPPVPAGPCRPCLLRVAALQPCPSSSCPVPSSLSLRGRRQSPRVRGGGARGASTASGASGASSLGSSAAGAWRLEARAPSHPASNNKESPQEPVINSCLPPRLNPPSNVERARPHFATHRAGTAPTALPAGTHGTHGTHGSALALAVPPDGARTLRCRGRGTPFPCSCCCCCRRGGVGGCARGSRGPRRPARRRLVYFRGVSDSFACPTAPLGRQAPLGPPRTDPSDPLFTTHTLHKTVARRPSGTP